MSLKIDAHHHLWDLAITPQPWIDGEALAPINKSFRIADYQAAVGANVDRSVLIQTVADASETPIMLAIADGEVQVAGVVGWVDLTVPDVEDELSALIASASGEWLVGIRHLVQDEPDPRWLCRPEVRRGLKAVGRAGLVFDLLTLPEQLDAAIETAEALPSVSFVVDHLSKPPIASGLVEPWATNIGRLGRLPNVTCKLSGLVTEADWSAWKADDLRPYVNVVLDVFGPDRLIFGSDWPVCLLASSYDQVIEAAEQLTSGLSPAERASVFGGNATRVYDLERREKS